MPLKALIVILNYRTPDLTIQCLSSLAPQMQVDFHVTIVDNNSEDGSPQKIQQAIETHNWQPWTTLLPLSTNKGFASGNNAAIRLALASPTPPQYIHLLNPDTIVHPNAIQALIDFMDSHPQAGIAGSFLQGEDNTPQHAAFRFPSILSEFENGIRLGAITKLLAHQRITMDISSTPHRADWVSGASFFVRTQVFQQIGLLDESYFLYYEEVDFCLRAKKHNWEIWFVPQSRITHLVGQSTELHNTKNPPKRIPKYWYDSRRHFFRKHHTRLYTILADLAWMHGFSLWRLRRLLQNKPDTDPPHMLRDFFRESSLFQ